MDWGFLTALQAFESFPAVGLLVLAILLLMTGKLTTVREVERVATDRDARLQAKDEEIARMTASHDAEVTRAREAEQEWRNAWRESQDIAAEVRAQNRDLVDSLYYVRKVVGALPSVKGGETE